MVVRKAAVRVAAVRVAAMRVEVAMGVERAVGMREEKVIGVVVTAAAVVVVVAMRVVRAGEAVVSVVVVRVEVVMGTETALGSRDVAKGVAERRRGCWAEIGETGVGQGLEATATLLSTFFSMP